jgi:ABC-type lipoprotein export system ATPase subunit
MLTLRDVTLRYGSTTALDAMSLDVARGEFVSVRGPSGSGKTSLLLIAGGMLRPTSGSLRFANRDLYELDSPARAALRASEIGFVFQTFHLVPYLDIVDNVRLAGGGQLRATRDEALTLLERMGLGPRATHKPHELSVGERQRTALARAMLPRPKLILADEPTGNLDPDNARNVLELLAGFHDDGGTVLLVTHGELGDRHADRVLRLEAGRLCTASPAIAPTSLDH